MTTKEIINQLIFVGQSVKESEVPADLLLFNKYDHINRMSRNAWKYECSSLSNDDLVLLMKGLTYVERELKWEGGSVAGVIWLFSTFIERGVSVEKIDNVSAWILKNTKNTYSPFGTIITLGARNYSEYLKLSEERRQIINSEIALDKKIEIESKQKKDKLKQMRSYSSQKRNSQERTNLILALNKISVRDQLVQISNDNTYVPNFYPTKCAASADLDILKSLPEETKKRLLAKLKGKYRGPWGSFKKRLISVCESTSNRKPWNI